MGRGLARGGTYVEKAGLITYRSFGDQGRKAVGSVSPILGEELGWGPTRGRERFLEGGVLSWEAVVGGKLDVCPKEA